MPAIRAASTRSVLAGTDTSFSLIVSVTLSVINVRVSVAKEKLFESGLFKLNLPPPAECRQLPLQYRGKQGVRQTRRDGRSVWSGTPPRL